MLKKIVLLSLGICFLLVETSYAQKAIDTLAASGYYKTADSLQKKGNYNDSSLFYKKALALYQKENVWEKVANCYNSLSEIQWRFLKNKSLQSAKKALKISEKYLAKDNIYKATAYSNMGSYYEVKAKYDSALVYHTKALKLRQQLLPPEHRHIAVSYNNLAGNYYAQSKYKKSLFYYKKALSISLKTRGSDHPFTGLIYSNIGAVYYSLGYLNKAINYSKKDISIQILNFGKSHLNLAYSYMNIGAFYHNLKRFDLALEFYQKSLIIFIKNNYSEGIGNAYGNMGDLWGDFEQYDKALKYHEKGLNIALQIFGEKNPNTADYYSDIGWDFYNKRNYKKALDYYNKALNIYKTGLKENHNKIALMYENIGNIYLQKKEYNNALMLYKKVEIINSSIFNQDHPKLARSYNNFANLFLKKESYDDALIEYQKALKVIQNKYGNNHVLNAKYYFCIAEVYYKKKEYSKSINYFDRALSANTKNKNLDINSYLDHKLALKTLHKKGGTLLAQYKETNSQENLNQSIDLLNRADLLIDHLRQSFQNYQDKLALAKQAKDIYTDAIAAQLLVYKDTKDEEALAQAWYYIEKSKANTLKELLEDNNAKNFAGLPNELLSLEKSIKSNRAYYQSQIVNEQSKDSIATEKIKDFENELFAINQREDSLLHLLKKDYPKYYQLKHKNDLITVEDIQKKINKKTTIVEFFTTDSITYTFVVSKNSISIKELPIAELAKKTENLNKTITSENSNEYKKIAHALYQELIIPIKNKLVGDELIIIPDGSLWHLNFDLLLTQKNNEQDNRKLSYLLKEYAISYANSADLLFNPIKNNDIASEIRKECLAFSFSDTTNSVTAKTMSLATLRDTGDDLPGARKEIRAISEIIDGQYYYGTQSNEANFKQNASQYSILHLAVHGEVDNQKPQNSKLYFTKSNDTTEDNLLYNHELFALHIPADLVVLSACNTGAGKIENGEGLMSLGNAFQYAGAKSLVLSKWEVSDKTTPQLMKYFYANLKAGMNKSKALQQAKLKHLKTTEAFYTNPFYWGSFYIIGNTDKISFESNLNDLFYWIIGIIICLLIIYFLVKTKY